MKCPHCQIEFHNKATDVPIGSDVIGSWSFEKQHCPSCFKLVVEVIFSIFGEEHNGNSFVGEEINRYFVIPKTASRTAPSREVPISIAKEYVESAAVICDSPMASAALSRRCLQSILMDKAEAKGFNLSKDIDDVLASNSLPSHLSEAIDAVRNIGNFAAHPTKSTSSGQVLPVEHGEAELNLDVLDGLFDFYYVQPAKMAMKMAALNAKLAAAGKPPVK